MAKKKTVRRPRKAARTAKRSSTRRAKPAARRSTPRSGADVLLAHLKNADRREVGGARGLRGSSG
jgi:hypothetical protein